MERRRRVGGEGAAASRSLRGVRPSASSTPPPFFGVSEMVVFFLLVGAVGLRVTGVETGFFFVFFVFVSVVPLGYKVSWTQRR